VGRHQVPRPVSEVRLLGGRHALDFVNTIHDRYERPVEDYLSDGERYLAWSQRVGLLDAVDAGRIAAAGGVPPPLMTEVRRLREQLHALFTARKEGRRPDPVAVAGLDTWLQKAWRGQVLDPRRGDRLVWRPEALDAALPLRRIALGALDVLQHVPRYRLKECAARGECGWLFVDDSRNNARRWCSMDLCGTAAKMRHYRRRPR